MIVGCCMCTDASFVPRKISYCICTCTKQAQIYNMMQAIVHSVFSKSFECMNWIKWTRIRELEIANENAIQRMQNEQNVRMHKWHFNKWEILQFRGKLLSELAGKCIASSLWTSFELYFSMHERTSVFPWRKLFAMEFMIVVLVLWFVHNSWYTDWIEEVEFETSNEFETTRWANCKILFNLNLGLLGFWVRFE